MVATVKRRNDPSGPWRSLRLWVLAYFEDEGAVPGAVGFIQTAGELLNYCGTSLIQKVTGM